MKLFVSARSVRDSRLVRFRSVLGAHPVRCRYPFVDRARIGPLVEALAVAAFAKDRQEQVLVGVAG